MTVPSTALPASFTADGHLWLTVPEAARRLKVTTARVYHLTSAQRVLTKAHQGLTYIRADSLDAYRLYRTQLAQLRATGRPLPLAR